MALALRRARDARGPLGDLGRGPRRAAVAGVREPAGAFTWYEWLPTCQRRVMASTPGGSIPYPFARPSRTHAVISPRMARSPPSSGRRIAGRWTAHRRSTHRLDSLGVDWRGATRAWPRGFRRRISSLLDMAEFARYEARVLRSFRAVTVVGDDDARWLPRQMGGDCAVHVVPNGVAMPAPPSAGALSPRPARRVQRQHGLPPECGRSDSLRPASLADGSPVHPPGKLHDCRTGSNRLPAIKALHGQDGICVTGAVDRHVAGHWPGVAGRGADALRGGRQEQDPRGLGGRAAGW